MPEALEKGEGGRRVGDFEEGFRKFCDRCPLNVERAAYRTSGNIPFRSSVPETIDAVPFANGGMPEALEKEEG